MDIVVEAVGELPRLWDGLERQFLTTVIHKDAENAGEEKAQQEAAQ